MKRAVVVGGGVAGLAAAHRLIEESRSKSLEIDVLLLEKRQRLGGTVLTNKHDGFVIEGGPDCTLSEKPWALALASRLGISERVADTVDENKGTYILYNSKLHQLPEGVMLMVPTKIMPMVTSSLLSWPGKVRMAMDMFIPRLKDDREESLAEFVTRRLGREALERIAEPLVAGVHAGHAESMSLPASFPRFKALEDEYGSLIRGMLSRMKSAKKYKPRHTMFVTFDEGLGLFTATIAEAIGADRIRTGEGAVSIEKTDGGRWVVNTSKGDAIDADSVILASPAYATADVLAGVDEELSGELAAIPYVGTATVSMAYDAAGVEHAMKGFGFVVPRVENRRIMAATFTSRKFADRAPDGKALIRCFVGGVQRPELVDADPEKLSEMAASEIGEILNIKADPLWAEAYRWPRSMPQTNIGHLDRMKRIWGRVKGLPGIEIAGGAYDGLGIPDCVRTGEDAAARIVEELFSVDK